MDINKIQILLLLLFLIANFPLIGVSRTLFPLKLFVFQGLLLTANTLLITLQEDSHTPQDSIQKFILPTLILLAKAIIIPYLIKVTIVATKAYRETRPIIPYGTSIVLAMLGTLVSIFLGFKLNSLSHLSSHTISISLAVIFIGLIAIIGRKNAVFQIMGYMAMENGIFLLTLPLSHTNPLIIDVLILVDVLVAVTVRKNAVYWISKEFKSIEVDKLTTLKW
ncbi:MAG: hypothetical protein HQK49_14415 [Oligoflexia bacterium]|nr:hypothetical protein [Oligoflexia bacterium]